MNDFHYNYWKDRLLCSIPDFYERKEQKNTKFM